MQNVPLPEGLDPIVITHRWFAATYNWTPDQVEDLPLDDYEWLPTVENAAAEARKFMQRMESKQGGGARG